MKTSSHHLVSGSGSLAWAQTHDYQQRHIAGGGHSTQVGAGIHQRSILVPDQGKK
jgi:hypothetical protein